jgi:hypothetical protein
MTLREVTRTVIDLVENMSGCPVAATEETSLKTLGPNTGPDITIDSAEKPSWYFVISIE